MFAKIVGTWFELEITFMKYYHCAPLLVQSAIGIRPGKKINLFRCGLSTFAQSKDCIGVKMKLLKKNRRH